MKILEKIGLALFSTLILILSIILCLMIFGWVGIDLMSSILERALQNQVTSNILLTLSITFILLAVKCIFFDSSAKQEMDYKNGILLENSDGKLLITRETIENLVNNVVKGFESAENVATRVELDKENNVMVYINLTVKENAIIKELSNNLQTKIKATIKKTSDLEVKEVNIKIKGVESQKNIVQD